jgi:hypothetical protein
MNQIVFKDPTVIDTPKANIVTQPHSLFAFWQTPGLYFAERISSNPAVRFVGELVEKDHIQVIIVVDNDPEELLDKIFATEEEMYSLPKSLRFDCRVRVVPAQENIETISMSYLPRYERPQIRK